MAYNKRDLILFSNLQSSHPHNNPVDLRTATYEQQNSVHTLASYSLTILRNQVLMHIRALPKPWHAEFYAMKSREP